MILLKFKNDFYGFAVSVTGAGAATLVESEGFRYVGFLGATFGKTGT